MLKAKVKKKGLTKLDKEIEKFAKLAKGPDEVKVGVPQSGPNYPDGTSLVMVAAVNEFGSLELNIPERSFLRWTVVNKRKTFSRFWNAQVAEELLKGELKPQTALRLLGQLAQKEVQKRIVSLREPPNSDETIERKGSSNPLVDEGLLRQSIRFEIGKRS